MVGKEGLTEEEYRQAKLLGNRNFLNKVVLEEAASVYANAEMVKKHRKPEVPFLLFCSDGKELGGFWVPLQKKYAERLNCELIQYACGHYLHHYKAGEMAETIRPFVENPETENGIKIRLPQEPYLCSYIQFPKICFRYLFNAKASKSPRTPQEIISPAVTVKKENQSGSRP